MRDSGVVVMMLWCVCMCVYVRAVSYWCLFANLRWQAGRQMACRRQLLCERLLDKDADEVATCVYARVLCRRLPWQDGEALTCAYTRGTWTGGWLAVRAIRKWLYARAGGLNDTWWSAIRIRWSANRFILWPLSTWDGALRQRPFRHTWTDGW